MEHHKNTIIGGGLSGLSAAYHLNEESTIFEKNERIGGVARSEQEDGFVFDYGPHILYNIDPGVSDLIQSVLEGNLVKKRREAYIYHKAHDLYTKFPFQAHLFGLPTNVVHDCLTGVVEVLKHENVKTPKNYHEWLYTRFGAGISDHLMIPYSGKLWAIGLDKMNYEWIDYRVPEPDFGVILEGALSDNSKLTGFNNDFWYPIHGGIESLSIGLSKLVKNINLNQRVRQILPNDKEIILNEDDRIKYDRLIITLPLPVIVSMIPDVPDEVAQAGRDLEHNSIVCVNLGVKRENISPYHWLYFYEDDFLFHRVSFPMNLSEKTTPKGHSSITCEIAYSKHRPLAVKGNDKIVQATIDGLTKAGILHKDDEITVKKVMSIKYAYVIYDLNHKKNVNIIHSYLRSHGIYPCGRFGEWEYFNMDHSIMSGKRIAEELNQNGSVNGGSKHVKAKSKK